MTLARFDGPRESVLFIAPKRPLESARRSGVGEDTAEARRCVSRGNGGGVVAAWEKETKETRQ